MIAVDICCQTLEIKLVSDDIEIAFVVSRYFKDITVKVRAFPDTEAEVI